MLNKKAEEVTGRGAGLSDVALKRKIIVMNEAIAMHKLNIHNPVDVLSKAGGLDIAGLTGVFWGGALYKTPVLIDGFISSVAVLLAVKLCPALKTTYLQLIFQTSLQKKWC